VAITALPYGMFMTDLAKGVHDFSTATYKVALLTSSYGPDYDTNATFADVSSFEVSTSGTGYSTATLTNVAVAYDSASNAAVINADNVSWTNLSATFRYAVVYRSSSSAATSRLVGLFDFGEDRVYSAEPFQLAFPSGVVTITVYVV
jgi:hypothetical protein